jgi:hypothetical protein
VVWIGIVQFPRRQTAAKLPTIKGSVVITIEAIKQSSCRPLRLFEINRAIVIGVEAVQRIAA